MKRLSPTLALTLLLVAGPVLGQAIDLGVHRQADGRAAMGACLTGQGAARGVRDG